MNLKSIDWRWALVAVVAFVGIFRDRYQFHYHEYGGPMLIRLDTLTGSIEIRAVPREGEPAQNVRIW